MANVISLPTVRGAENPHAVRGLDKPRVPAAPFAERVRSAGGRR